MDQVYAMQDNAENMSATADFIDANVNTRDGGATEGEVGLAEQVADLATQGTGDSSEQVMPAAEAYVGSKSQPKVSAKPCVTSRSDQAHAAHRVRTSETLLEEDVWSL
jgi:hypothetical protein